MRAACLFLLWPTLSAAETPMTGAEFQAHIGQNTISYGYSTGARGTADYGPGRTLLWAFEGDPCVQAFWYEDGQDICFAYEDGTMSACWLFTLEDNRLRGVATRLGSGDPVDDLAIFELSHSDQPLTCPGPKVGV